MHWPRSPGEAEGKKIMKAQYQNQSKYCKNKVQPFQADRVTHCTPTETPHPHPKNKKNTETLLSFINKVLRKSLLYRTKGRLYSHQTGKHAGVHSDPIHINPGKK